MILQSNQTHVNPIAGDAELCCNHQNVSTIPGKHYSLYHRQPLSVNKMVKLLFHNRKGNGCHFEIGLHINYISSARPTQCSEH